MLLCNDSSILFPPVNPYNRITSPIAASLHHGRGRLESATNMETLAAIGIKRSGIVRTCVQRNCDVCKRAFYAEIGAINRGGGRFCSRKCYYQSDVLRKRGPSHHNYKDGGKSASRRYQQNNREKLRCRRLSREAVSAGVILRQPCEVCGSNNVQIHHDDYSQPMKVRWFCRKHHLEHHNGWVGDRKNIFAL